MINFLYKFSRFARFSIFLFRRIFRRWIHINKSISSMSLCIPNCFTVATMIEYSNNNDIELHLSISQMSQRNKKEKKKKNPRKIQKISVNFQKLTCSLFSFHFGTHLVLYFPQNVNNPMPWLHGKRLLVAFFWISFFFVIPFYRLSHTFLIKRKSVTKRNKVKIEEESFITHFSNVISFLCSNIYFFPFYFFILSSSSLHCLRSLFQ